MMTSELLKSLGSTFSVACVARKCNTWGLPAFSIVSELQNKGYVKPELIQLPPALGVEGGFEPKFGYYRLTKKGIKLAGIS